MRKFKCKNKEKQNFHEVTRYKTDRESRKYVAENRRKRIHKKEKTKFIQQLLHYLEE